ncbi:MAG: GNAT family N-acetyltransferase [Fusobacteriaceae bacterium]
MKFKKIEKTDKSLIEKIVNIEEEVFGKNGGADYWLVKALARYGTIFVLISNDEIVSIAEFMQVQGENKLFLYGFLTREKYRGKGYAKELMKACENEFRKTKIDSILLTVDPENKIGINLYTKLGYSNIEFQEDEYGKGVHRFLFEKKL